VCCRVAHAREECSCLLMAMPHQTASSAEAAAQTRKHERLQRNAPLTAREQRARPPSESPLKASQHGCRRQANNVRSEPKSCNAEQEASNVPAGRAEIGEKVGGAAWRETRGPHPSLLANGRKRASVRQSGQGREYANQRGDKAYHAAPGLTGLPREPKVNE
jgi:hypothetical protein